MDNNTTTNFSDVFKDNFLSGFSLSTQNLTLPNVLISLGIAFLLGMVIYFIYKKDLPRRALQPQLQPSRSSCSRWVTTLVIMCISSAPALSLGMVGALSIVRFRTAVKDPMDTVYMFWAIAVGITVGANFILFSIIGTLVIAVILLVLSFTSNQTGQNYLLVVHYDDRYAKEVTNAVNKMVPRYRLKSKTATRNGVEMTLENRYTYSIVDNLLGIPGVMDATLVAFQNEIA